jgi:hypothetical protein
LEGGLHVVINILVHERIPNDEEEATNFEFLGKIENPNLVPLVGYCLAKDQRIEIYDFMENGILNHWIHDLLLVGYYIFKRYSHKRPMCHACGNLR